MSERAFADYDRVLMSAPAGVGFSANRALPGLVMLASSAALGVWLVYIRPIQAPVMPVIQTAPQMRATSPFGELAVPSIEASAPQPASREARTTSKPTTVTVKFEAAAPFGAMFRPDPYGILAQLRPSASRETLALPPNLDLDLEAGPAPAENQVAVAPPVLAPLPPRRPADLGVAPSPGAESAPALASRDSNPPAASAPGFFERLFGGVHLPQAPQGQAVAYANPETTTLSRTTPQSAILRSVSPWSSAPSALARYDKFTAVYDIEARTVYLPNGTRLEAHSGLGELKDDPKHVDARARGATPPDVYELGLREGLFHGVQALRLKPVGSGEQFGRTGLLAHPYMLGAEGDSFGCVSFKDYDAFLTAYQSGQVKKLAVVAKLD